MSTLHLVISPKARDDLRSMYQLCLSTWGQSQSAAYLETIKELLWLLTEQPLLGIERPDISDKVRSFSIKRHVVFYQVLATHVAIIRVLHVRQDPYRLGEL